MDQPMEPVVPPPFSELLRRHRLAAGLTQEALAERAGLSVTGIQKLERGPGHPYRDTVERLIAGLSLSFEAQADLRAASRRLSDRRSDDTSERSATLPVALTSFVGREREIAELSGLLASVRLLTLTGVGGCGKTRLALEVARAVSSAYPDGVRFVDLAPLVDPALVPQAVATVLGVRETPLQPLVKLASVLRTRQLLLVLDNCEHLIDACAQFADALLRTCPGLRILATSRAALVIDGEVTRQVSSLSRPPLNDAEGESALRGRHGDWYLALAERALPELTGPDQRTWYQRLTLEYDNLRAALEWSHKDPDGAEPELRLAAALGRYWDIHGPRRDGRTWVERALARGPTNDTPARAQALLWAGTFAAFEGEADRCQAMLNESVEVARRNGDTRVLTNALRHLAGGLHAAGDPRGREVLEDALHIANAAGDWREVAYALCYLGRIFELDGDVLGAECRYREGLVAARRSGDALPASQLLLNRSWGCRARRVSSGARAHGGEPGIVRASLLGSRRTRNGAAPPGHACARYG
jgi:transcriptional regulator with XRE-family HTH domain